MSLLLSSECRSLASQSVFFEVVLSEDGDVKSYCDSENTEIVSDAGLSFVITKPRMNTKGRGINREESARGENNCPIIARAARVRIGTVLMKPIVFERCLEILPW